MRGRGLEALLGGLSDMENDEPKRPRSAHENRQHAISLQAAADHYLAVPHPFKPGDLVTWKPGLRNKKTPNYGEPLVVIRVLSEPIYDQAKDAGSPYFNEPLTLVLGEIDKEGDLLIFHYDGRRFEPWAD